MEERDLIYDWNSGDGKDGAFDWTRARIDLNDETLRDGLQSPSVTDPSLDVKTRLLHLMAELGIVAADIGLPGAGPRVVEQVRAFAREIRDHKLPIARNCAARTVIADIEPIVRISEEVGIKIEAATFIGSSPIRQYTEDWTVDRIVDSTYEAVSYAVKHGLPVMYVTEDTTRARPETLKALYGAAIECGAGRICLADTVGMPIPVNYPVVGTDAFRTGTGVHAAAIIKAKKKGHTWLADRVYSSVPAEEFGFEQRIEISPVSGLSNVKYWLEQHGYDPDDDAACRALFDAAKRTDHVLTDEECHRLLSA